VVATADIFLFEEFRLDRRGDGLSRRNERRVFVPVPIGLRALDVLSVLVERSGALVTKEEIIATVWGRTVVENANLTVQISALRRILDEGRPEGSCIQTVAARGYRFVTPVTRFEHTAPTSAADSKPASEIILKSNVPSIAVLAFQNLTGDAQQEHLIDGIVEEITTALSRLRWLSVIGRNWSISYQGKVVDVKQARELGIRYALAGSVHQVDNRIRITAQTLELMTGALIWTERFSGTLDDVFDLYDQVASGVVGAIEPKLRQSEIERATQKLTSNLDAYDLCLCALAVWNDDSSLLLLRNEHMDENIHKAVILLKRALSIDPGYAPAAALVGWTRLQQLSHCRIPVSANEAAEASALAWRALEMGRDDPVVLWMTGATLQISLGNKLQLRLPSSAP
jgi:TolB-like protein